MIAQLNANRSDNLLQNKGSEGSEFTSASQPAGSNCELVVSSTAVDGELLLKRAVAHWCATLHKYCKQNTNIL